MRQKQRNQIIEIHCKVISKIITLPPTPHDLSDDPTEARIIDSCLKTKQLIVNSLCTQYHRNSVARMYVLVVFNGEGYTGSQKRESTQCTWLSSSLIYQRG